MGTRGPREADWRYGLAQLWYIRHAGRDAHRPGLRLRLQGTQSRAPRLCLIIGECKKYIVLDLYSEFGEPD